MYLHALTNKMVPDASSLSIEELPEVATSQNNVEYRLNFNKFYQGRIDRSFCGDESFCSLKQVLINAFSDSSNAMLVLDGYVMAVIRKIRFFVPIWFSCTKFAGNSWWKWNCCCFKVFWIRWISWLKGFEYSLTLLDEINSLLHVVLHSVTVTNCSKAAATRAIFCSRRWCDFFKFCRVACARSKSHV